MTNEMEERFLTLRRELIARRFSNLNPEQQKAVLATEGPLLLLAGAGSGKTTVLIHRIANLLRFGCGADSFDIPHYITEDDVAFLESYLDTMDDQQAPRADSLCAMHPAAPWSIIAITFTNKAAGELKSRLEQILGPAALDVWAMTFHAACCRILRRDIEKLGYSSSFTIYDTADSQRVVKDIVAEMNLDDKTFDARSVLGRISKAKDKMQSPQEFLLEAKTNTDFRMVSIAQIYKSYQARLKEANAVDFDDIILLTVKLLLEHEDVRTHYQKKFRYVLIDEYQDTNHLQFLLAKLLSGGYENICVVGDDDQSIYRFRGATIENILGFEKQYKQAQTIRLEQNYRSSQHILTAANAVISNNQGRKGKELWTKNDKGEQIYVYEAYNETDEANFVTTRLFSMSKGKNFHDYAVLYRTNAQSNALEYSFKRNGVPYRIIGGTRFFDRAEIKDMLAYLCVISNRTDDLRLRRIINQPPRGIGAKTVETAIRLAESQQAPLYSVVENPKDYAALEKSVAKLGNFTHIIEECTELLETLTLAEFYDAVLQKSGYVTMLEAKPTVENRTRLENVRELKSSIVQYEENTEVATLAGFLAEIALYTDIEQYDQDADAVVMMTIHASKGLEFPNVFLVGCEEGLFPGTRALGEMEEMEEERRLCYVAITRARKTLTITHAKQRMLYGRTSINRPSRFVGELPADCTTGKVKESVYVPASLDYEQKKSYESYRKKTAPLPKPSNAPAPEFRKGEMVEHTVFGAGMVLSVLPMGNDALLEIAFDDVGTKKLMAKTAGKHMRKR